MTTLTVNIENKKQLKALKAVFDVLGMTYTLDNESERPLNKKEQALYDGLKRSFEEIRLFEQGKIELRDATELLDEL